MIEIAASDAAEHGTHVARHRLADTARPSPIRNCMHTRPARRLTRGISPAPAAVARTATAAAWETVQATAVEVTPLHPRRLARSGTGCRHENNRAVIAHPMIYPQWNFHGEDGRDDAGWEWNESYSARRPRPCDASRRRQICGARPHLRLAAEEAQEHPHAAASVEVRQRPDHVGKRASEKPHAFADSEAT